MSSSAAEGDRLQLNDPQTLYRRWEASQWSPFEIDRRRDREQWKAMPPAQRELVHFVLCSLIVAEERITTKLSGLVAAHGSEEEATFLAAQQVDEARHMQFYARFQDEVIAAPQSIAAHVRRAREQVSDAFRHIFDEALVRAHEQLVRAPQDLAAKVRFVTLYHQVLEGTLGLTSFRFITGYLHGQGLLTGFVEGYSKIHHDETRHIGLRRLVLAPDGPRAAGDGRRRAGDAARPAGVGRRLAQAAGGAGDELLGVGDDDIRAFALGGLTRRLKIIGVPLESVCA